MLHTPSLATYTQWASSRQDFCTGPEKAASQAVTVTYIHYLTALQQSYTLVAKKARCCKLAVEKAAEGTVQ